MTIRINDSPVDFTLEHEITFADLHRSLSQWAHAEQLELLSVLGDGKALAPDDITALEGLDVIEVEAVPTSESALARLALVARFFAAAALDPTDDLRAQYQGFRGVMESLLGPAAHRLSDELALLDGDWSGTGVAEAAARVARQAAALHAELVSPHAALTEALDRLDASLPGEELARLFQKGDDREGFERILTLFTAFEDVTRRAELVGADQPWSEFQEGLRPFLGEARDALAASDQILLTDLLEYEIVPRLKEIRGCFANLDRADGRP
jgi:hypothetical protein